MKVFISWSGSQSKHIARALRDWLRDVIQNLDPWMSEIDIGAGQQWVSELWNGLEDSYFGVVCLTAENLESPWLHYEAGALAKTVDRRVCPYLYKIESSAVKGPLLQSQMKQADEQGTKELVQSINDTIKIFNEKGLLTNEKSLSPEQLNKAFSRCWPELEKALNVVPPSTVAAPPQRETREMVEEILEIVRNQSRPPLHTEALHLFDSDSDSDRYYEPEAGITVTPIRNGGGLYLKRMLPRRVAQEPPPPSDTPQEGKTPSK